jgi:solute:Na+ symporter, SSS family
MSQHFTNLDWAVVGVYFMATMSIGFYFHHRSRSTEGFTAANRTLPGWVCGLSIFATYVSSISFLALPGKAFVDNWNPFVFSLSIPLATWIGVRWFVPYYRLSGEVSAYALLERRFGTWARVYASVCYLLTQVARMGVIMYLMALPLAVIFGWDIRVLIVVTGICVTVYSFVGGIVAVIWTDAIQAVVLFVGAVACLIVMMTRMPGGPVEVLRMGWQNDKFSLGSFGPSLSEATVWVVLIYGLFINLQNFGIDQSFVQRYIASSSDREARKSLWLGGLLYLPVSALFFLLGTSLFAFYTSRSGELSEVRQIVARQQVSQQTASPIPATQNKRLSPEMPRAAPGFTGEAEITLDDIGDQVFPHFIAKHLPPGATGLLVAAIFAAAMSSVSTSLNSSATLVLRDYYQRFLNPAATERQSMAVLYAATIAWGALGTGMALFLVQVTESALDMWWTLASIFSGGMLGLFLLGILSRAVTSVAAATAVMLGALVIGWITVSPAYWARVDADARIVDPDRRVVALDEFAAEEIRPGENLHLKYSWIDEASDRRRAAAETHKIRSISAERREITLAAPLQRQPHGPMAVYRDTVWYQWRSPFHNYLAIVIGTCTVLLVGFVATVLAQAVLTTRQLTKDL